VFASTRPILTILDDPKKLTAPDDSLRATKDKLRRELADLWQKEIADGAIERVLRSGKKEGLAMLRPLAKEADFKNAWREPSHSRDETARTRARRRRFR
jgi:hypothetical protein